MLNTKLEDMLNDQIAHELLNEKKYRVIASWFKKKGLEGLAKYFYDWSKEENDHASLIQSHIDDRNGCVDIPVTDEVMSDFNDTKEIAEFVLATEVGTTEELSKIADKAMSIKDYLSYEFLLNTMIKEQIEEEDKAQTLLDRLSMASGDMAALLVIDANMGD